MRIDWYHGRCKRWSLVAMGWEAGILRAELRWHFIDRPTRAGGLRRRVRYGPGLDGGLEARWAAGAMADTVHKAHNPPNTEQTGGK